MTMQIISLIQGTPEWHEHRAKHFNASDAPAMMGCSSYKSRAQLVKEKATGITAEVDAATQRRFDDGHRFEALARPLAEAIIGEDLSPCVGVNGKNSASFDGITFMEDVPFEHKSLNERLREAMFEGCTGADLPLEYQIQMEHQCMVADTAEKVLFMASKWDANGNMLEERHCWYYPNLKLRAEITAGWAQLEKDVAAYDPAAARPAPVVATPVESLPAVVVQVQGALTVGGNLPVFGDALRAFIERIPTKPATDQEFADADAACKALKKAEEALAQAEDGALAQISDVEQMRRTVADLKTLARTTRLATEKLVAAEKDARRTAIVTGAQAKLDQHVQALNLRLGTNWLPRVAGGFGEAIKGKKSLANMEDAVAVALTSAKADMDVLAERLEANRKHLHQNGVDWIALFADFATVGAKAEEDFQALAALRIGQHKQAEEARLEAERERIRQEEAAKLQQATEANNGPDSLTAHPTGNAAAPVFEQSKPAQTISKKAPEATNMVAPTGQSMTLSAINAQLGIFAITAATLAALGIPTAKEKNAVHMDTSHFDGMCQGLIEHIQAVRAHMAANAVLTNDACAA